MYSYNDFERLFLRYKLEGIPAGISIEKFCMSNQVPYNLFSKVQGYPEEDSSRSGFGGHFTFLTLFIGEPPCGGFPWGTRQNWTIT